MVSLPQALLADLIRRYWVLGIECSMLEVHHLTWLLVRQCQRYRMTDQSGGCRADYRGHQGGLAALTQ